MMLRRKRIGDLRIGREVHSSGECDTGVTQRGYVIEQSRYGGKYLADRMITGLESRLVRGEYPWGGQEVGPDAVNHL